MALPFLAARDPETYGPILRHWHDEGGSLVELERNTFDWDHAEVATWMCYEWDFPEGIAEAIGCHHETCYGEYEPPAPVSLVSQLRETENTLGLDGLIEEAHSRFGISLAELERLAESSFKDAEALARLML
jgi:HD-like signal output (HDOD) protein